MLKLLLGDPNARKLKRYQPIVSDINLLEEEIAPLSDDALRGRTAAFQERLEARGIDVYGVRLREASLFLSMLPLHNDDPRKVLAFVLNAIGILDELAAND